jgi:hypothetical protein
LIFVDLIAESIAGSLFICCGAPQLRSLARLVLNGTKVGKSRQKHRKQEHV